MEGVLIGTTILWILSAVIVTPLTNWSVANRMVTEGIEVGSLEELPPEKKSYWQKKATSYFIVWDVIVLAIAGFVGGLLGFLFIGISIDTKGWPGMLAFIGASFLGGTLTKPF